MKRTQRKFQIGVIGSAGRQEYAQKGGATDLMMKKAQEVGALLAQEGMIVITGGKKGIMEAAAKGAKLNSGITTGIIKGKTRFKSNRFVDVEIVSGMSADGFDELLLVLMSDALIAIGGGAGTLQEIAIAYRNQKPVVVLDGLGGWSQKLIQSYLDERKKIKINVAKTPKEAVKKAILLAKKSYEHNK